MSLDNYKNYLALNHTAKNTQRAYFAQANKFHRYFSELNQENLNSYLTQRINEKISNTTFNFIINALKSYAQYLKIKVEFPKYRTLNKSAKEFLTEEEVEEICSYMGLLFEDGLKRQLIIRLMFTSGLRPCEVVKLKKSDFNFEKNLITVRNTKDKEDRVTICIPELHSFIKNEFNQSPTDSAFNITKWYIREIFDKLNNDMHYKKHVHSYMLRHSFAHKCLKEGIDIYTLRNMLGHWDIQMTQEYLKLTNEEVITKAIKLFNYKGV